MFTQDDWIGENERGHRVTCVCEKCGKVFERYKSQAIMSKRKYCSRECSGKKKGKKILICKNCGESFDVRLSQDNKRFCSKKCYTEHQKKTAIRITVTCDCCGKIFEREPGRMMTAKRYCSRICKQTNERTTKKDFPLMRRM